MQMTTTTTLRQAHDQWASRPADQRFASLESLAASVNGRRMRSRSADVNVDKMQVGSYGGRLILNGTVKPCEPTHWSFGQLAQVISAPAAYLRTLPQPLLVENIRHGLSQGGRENMKFMSIAQPEGKEGPNILQAITSTTYGRIWDADCVAMVQRIVERTGGKFHNPLAYGHKGDPNGFKTLDASKVERAGLYASDRDVFMFLIDGGSLLEAGPRAKLNRGFFVWNSETGSRSFGLTTFLFNVVCGNNIVWGAQDVNRMVIRHTSGGPYRFDAQATPQLLAYANASAAPLEATVRKACDKVLWSGKEEDQDDLRGTLARVAKFSNSEVREAITFAKAEEGDCRTLWQMVQGFTAYARGFDYVDARVDLETRAGKLLSLAE